MNRFFTELEQTLGERLPIGGEGPTRQPHRSYHQHHSLNATLTPYITRIEGFRSCYNLVHQYSVLIC